MHKRRPLDSDGNPPMPGQLSIEEALASLSDDERNVLNEYTALEPKLRAGQSLTDEEQSALSHYQNDVAPKLAQTKRPMTAREVVAARLKGPK